MRLLQADMPEHIVPLPDDTRMAKVLDNGGSLVFIGFLFDPTPVLEKNADHQLKAISGGRLYSLSHSKPLRKKAEPTI